MATTKQAMQLAAIEVAIARAEDSGALSLLPPDVVRAFTTALKERLDESCSWSPFNGTVGHAAKPKSGFHIPAKKPANIEMVDALALLEELGL